MTLAAVGVALIVTSLLVWASQGFPLLPQSFSRTPLAVLPGQITAAVYIAVGALLAHRLPRNPVGWLLLLVGLSLTPILPTALLVAQAMETFRPASDLVRIAAWSTSSLTTSIAIGCLALAGLLFPDGRLPSHRLRWDAVLIVLAAALFGAATAFDPVGLIWYPTIANPFAAPAPLAPAFEVARAVGALALLVALGAMVAAVMLRYRTGDPITRAQLRWIMLAVAFGGLMAVPFVITRYVITVSDAAGQVFAAAVFAGICAIPLAAAFAITRHGLFGIDRLISRTLVYVPLVGILGGLYAATVALFQRLYVAVTGEPSDAPFLIAVFLIAAAFTPVRKGMEGTVDRWARSGQHLSTVEDTATTEPSVPISTESPPERTATMGEPIAASSWRAPGAGGGGAEDHRTAAAVAALRRLEERLTSQTDGATTDRNGETIAIDADGTVDCPAGLRVPFTVCFGCPFLTAVDTSPPGVRCLRQASGLVAPG